MGFYRKPNCTKQNSSDSKRLESEDKGTAGYLNDARGAIIRIQLMWGRPNPIKATAKEQKGHVLDNNVVLCMTISAQVWRQFKWGRDR